MRSLSPFGLGLLSITGISSPISALSFNEEVEKATKGEGGRLADDIGLGKVYSFSHRQLSYSVLSSSKFDLIDRQ